MMACCSIMKIVCWDQLNITAFGPMPTLRESRNVPVLLYLST